MKFISVFALLLNVLHNEIKAQDTIAKKNIVAILNSCSYYNKSNSEEASFFNPEIEAEHTI